MRFLKDWSSDADSTTSIGSGWTLAGAALQVIGGDVAPTNTSTAQARRSDSAAATGGEAYAQATVLTAGTAGEVGPVLFTDASTTTDSTSAYIAFRYAAATTRFQLMYKPTGTTALTGIGTGVTRTLAANDVMRLVVHDGIAYGYVNGTLVVQGSVTANADATAWKYPGFRFKGDASSRISAVEGGDYSAIANEGQAGSPASLLNIGTGAGQNHFALQYARKGASAYSTVPQADLIAGFEESPYFARTTDGKRVAFRVDVDSPTTSGSSFPRAELREVNANGTNAAGNYLSGTHSIRGKTRITHLPSVKPEVVVVQLFDGDSDAIVIRTSLISGVPKLVVRVNGTTQSPRLMENYVPGTEFEWMIQLVDGIGKVYVNDMTTPIVTTTAGQLPAGSAYYFKAGCYAQSNTTYDAASEYVSLELRDLQVSHPGVTPDPVGTIGGASVPAAPAYSATLGLSATGSLSVSGVKGGGAVTPTYLFPNANAANTWSSTDGPVNVGTRFTVDTGGAISGIRYYKRDTLGDGATIKASLYLPSGTALATASRVQQASDPIGWVTVPFVPAVPVTTFYQYTAAILSTATNYTVTTDYSPLVKVDTPPLHAPVSYSQYMYGAQTMPNNQGGYSYLVDPVYIPSTNDYAAALPGTAEATLSLSPQPNAQSVLNLSSSATLALQATPKPTRTVTLSGAGSLAVTATGMSVAPTLALTGAGQLGLSGSASQTSAASVPLSGSGQLTVDDLALSASSTASLSGSGTLSRIGSPNLGRSVALSGAGSLTMGVSSFIAAKVNLSGSASLAVTGSTVIKAFDSDQVPSGADYFVRRYAEGFRLYVTAGTMWGVSTPDPSVEQKLGWALDAGLKIGLYARNPNYYASAISAAGKWRDRLQFFALDVETDPGIPVTRAMVDGVKALGVRPIIYSGWGMWPSIQGATANDFSDLLLWDTDTRAELDLTYKADINSPTPVAYGGWNVPGNMRFGIQQKFEQPLDGMNVDLNSFDSQYFIETGTFRAAALPLSAEGTLSATASAKPVQGLAATGSGSLSLVGKPNASRSVALSGLGTLGMTSRPNQAANVALSAVGGLSVAGSPSTVGSVQSAGTGTLAVAGADPATAATVSLSGTASLGFSAIANSKASASLALSASGTLGTATSVATTQSVSLAGGGILSLSGSVYTTAQTSLYGSGQLSIGGKPSPTGKAILSSSGTLVITGALNAPGAVSLGGGGTLDLTSRPGWRPSLALSGAATLAMGAKWVPVERLSRSGAGTLSLEVAELDTLQELDLYGLGSLILASKPSTQVYRSGAGTLTIMAGVPVYDLEVTAQLDPRSYTGRTNPTVRSGVLAGRTWTGKIK